MGAGDRETRCAPACISKGAGMAHNPFRIFRASSAVKQQDAAHIRQAQTAMAEAREALKQAPPVDTFAGRKTQEPFPKGDEE